MRWRMMLFVTLLVFVGTLAITIAQRLSSEAMSVMVGVLAGVTASIPTSAIVVWLALKAWQIPSAPAPRKPESPSGDAPKVFVVTLPPTTTGAYPALTPTQAQALLQGWPLPTTPLAPPMPPPRPPRQFTMIGKTGEVDEWQIES